MEQWRAIAASSTMMFVTIFFLASRLLVVNAGKLLSLPLIADLLMV